MKNNEVFSEKERNFIVLMIVLLLGAVLVYALRGIFGAILGTFLMYTLFRNLNVFLIEKWKWNNS
ncbi:MAG TPA: AI-2E family transporter, partial [Candidatus Sphingobacterium stercoripullorum]|nr:AI-2E family transporter [Candidatus Sphingobacterium stercoripullorum]